MRELCYKVVIVGQVGYCSSVISAHVVALAIYAYICISISLIRIVLERLVIFLGLYLCV